MPSEIKTDRFRVLLSCPDRRGIVAEVSRLLAEQGANVTAASQFTDPSTGQFFVRYEVETPTETATENSIQEGVSAGLLDLLQQAGAELMVRRADHRPRVALLASKASHCLVEVLQRWRTGELPCDIVSVIANHPHIEEFAGWFKVPFHHVEFGWRQGGCLCRGGSHPAAGIRGCDRARPVHADHSRRHGRVPSRPDDQHPPQLSAVFVGARPYEQAHARGVKLVGATCHYVTPELDQGPIIDQEVVRISHRDSAADLRRKGRICEREALARGLRLHLEDRVFVHGNRTVVFD